MTPRFPTSGPIRLLIVAIALLAASVLTTGFAHGAEEGATVAPLAFPRIASVRLGFDGAYKLGHWTELVATVNAGAEPFTGVVEVVAADVDGVPVTYSTPAVLRRGVSVISAAVCLRVGQDGAPLSVRLVDSVGRERDRHRYFPGVKDAAVSLPPALAPKLRLIVTLGAREDIVASLTRGGQGSQSADLRTVRLASASHLPSAWHGYEGVDAVVVSSADASAFDLPEQELAERIAALSRWIERGGRLVLFVGAKTADMFVHGGPLAPLLPGRFSGESATLQDFTSLEIFSGASVTIIRAGNRLEVPQLVDVDGRLLAEGPGKLPLIVRGRRGLGEITFVAADPEAPPLEDWPERTALVRQSLDWPAPAIESAAARRTPLAADLTNQLRSALDQQFTGVSATPFAWVAGLVLAYVALIGPIDYFLLRRLDRMSWTWLTFPLVVIAASAAAYALSYREKGRDLRVNQLEIVDVDVSAGQARGTLITHLFNPCVDRFDLTLEPRFAGKGLETGDQIPEAPTTDKKSPPIEALHLQPPAPSLQPRFIVSWLGVPGYGLGAMQGQRGQLAPFDQGYQTKPDGKLDGMPVEQWSTKSLEATWCGHVGDVIDARIYPLGDEQLAGRIVNHTGVRLEDCVLIRGRWAYQLPPLDDGAKCQVDDRLPNATVKTLLTRVAAGDDSRVRLADDGSVPFDPLSTDVARITKLMMFYDAIGGPAYAETPHRYLARLDLSRLLRNDQAVLLARVSETAGSHWLTGGSAPPGGERPASRLEGSGDRHWTYYRFVISLSEQSEEGVEGPIFGPAATPAR